MPPTQYDWDKVSLAQWKTLSNSAIARLVGSTPAAATHQRRKLGLPPLGRTPPTYDWATVDGLWATHTNRQIADLLGAPVGTVRCRRHQENHPPSPRFGGAVDVKERHSERVVLLLKPADADRLFRRARGTGQSATVEGRRLLLWALDHAPER